MWRQASSSSRNGVLQMAFKERTLSNVNTDLSKPEIAVRWYLGDDGPIAGTNHMQDRMSGFCTFRF